MDQIRRKISIVCVILSFLFLLIVYSRWLFLVVFSVSYPSVPYPDVYPDTLLCLFSAFGKHERFISLSDVTWRTFLVGFGRSVRFLIGASVTKVSLHGRTASYALTTLPSCLGSTLKKPRYGYGRPRHGTLHGPCKPWGSLKKQLNLTTGNRRCVLRRDRAKEKTFYPCYNHEGSVPTAFLIYITTFIPYLV